MTATGKAILSGAEAIAAADKVVDDLICAAQAGRERARVTKAPAGAGKTGAVVRLVGALADARARVGVVTQTNEQAFDVVRRLADAHPRRTVSFMPASGIELPADVVAKPNVGTIAAAQAQHTAIVVATADKWAYAREALNGTTFDAGIVDEAYQMTSAKLYRLADYFKSLDLIGDPGQLDPFTTVDESRWEGLRSNPVMNAVSALLAHHPGTSGRELPVTRRLPAHAASIVREAFYPELSFGPATAVGERRLELGRGRPNGPSTARMDGVWATAARSGWAFLELPERQTMQIDPELVDSIADVVARLLERGARVYDERTGGSGRELTEGRVAVGVAHRDQRAAVLIALEARGLTGVVVDTANRLQGREFDLTVVWHPLAGRTDATAFHLDAGRLCVLATRHRQACIVVGRAGTARLLEDHPPPGRVVLGVQRDSEFDGWEAHVRVVEHLASVRC